MSTLSSPSFVSVQRDRLMYRAWKLQSLLFPDKIGRFTLVDGSWLECPFHAGVARALYMGHMENAEVAFVRQCLRPGGVFLDVGANCGLFTIIAAKCVGPNGCVFAFEPSPREAAFLQRNIDLNRLKNVSVVESAVGDVPGVSRFAISHDGGLNSLARTNHAEQRIEQWIEVPVTTLDEFVKRWGLDVATVALIKIDVEGAEHLALDGARDLLSRPDAPPILCEFSDLTSMAFGSSGKDLWKRLETLGYTLHTLAFAGNAVQLQHATPRERYDYENLVALKRQHTHSE